MHDEAKKFLAWARAIFGPHLSAGCRVLDVGSTDINGNNRWICPEGSRYVGCDVAEGKNVDVVGPVHEVLAADAEPFDLVLSTEHLEHDMHWRKSMTAMCGAIRDGGALFFTCAGLGRFEHGTTRTSPEDSKTVEISDDDWGGYYDNRSVVDVVPFLDGFGFVRAFYNQMSRDLYVFAVKGEFRTDAADYAMPLLYSRTNDEGAYATLPELTVVVTGPAGTAADETTRSIGAHVPRSRIVCCARDRAMAVVSSGAGPHLIIQAGTALTATPPPELRYTDALPLWSDRTREPEFAGRGGILAAIATHISDERTARALALTALRADWNKGAYRGWVPVRGCVLTPRIAKLFQSLWHDIPSGLENVCIGLTFAVTGVSREFEGACGRWGENVGVSAGGFAR